ncbi:MAG: DUF2191 domain-containing protein [Verrucomicrobia bacterium]|nr:DUF2191 domain-containing protein [Verrucomicrobiota bacterium]
MRTTLDIDPAILGMAKAMAAQSNQSTGAIISHLALKGIESSRAKVESMRNGFPVFSKSEESPIIIQKLVKELLADEDLPV